MKEAQEVMDQLLSGNAEPWRYIAGTVSIVVFVCFILGFLVWFCYIVGNCCWCTRKTCCGVWWLIKKLTPWGWSSRRDAEPTKCLSSYRPFEEEFELAEEACLKEPSVINNSRGDVVVVPYCKKHLADLTSRLFKPGKAFERNEKYPINFFFAAVPGKLDYSNVVANAISLVESLPRSQPGFIYIFRSKADQDAMIFAGDNQDYFFKIGMTRRSTAKERVAEWDQSIFVNEAGVGWWKTTEASRAELLVHAVLARQRVARWNQKTKEFEIEWFFIKHVDAVKAIEAVVEAVRTKEYSKLRV